MKQVALFVMSLLLAASSAIAQDVRYNFAFDTHFKRFKTYKWVEVKEAQKVDDVKDTEIKAALEATLAKNHLTKTDADSADLYIGYQVGVVAEKQLAFYNADWRYGPGWYKKVGTPVPSTTRLRARPPQSLQASWQWICMTRQTIVWSGAASSVGPSNSRPHPTSRKRASRSRWPSS